jgi:hypothetical protein
MEASEDGDPDASSEDDAMIEVNDSEARSEDDPGATREDDDLEASNEDDTELQSLFPSILSFLDLSTLRLRQNVPNRLPLPLSPNLRCFEGFS